MTDYDNLVAALRYCADRGGIVNCNTICKYGWEDSHGCKGILMTDAADAIEEICKILFDYSKLSDDQSKKIYELEQQLPKRGEWIYEDLDNFRKYKVTCPHCGAWFVGNYDAYDEPSDFNYCPHCGNICNPANLDWENELKEREKEARAKMEVQE